MTLLTPSPTQLPTERSLVGESILRELSTLRDASPRDLGPGDIKALRTLFEDPKYGLYLFAQTIFGLRLKPEVHLPICQFYSRWGQSLLKDGGVITTPPPGGDAVQDSWRRLMIRIPRDCLKTTLCTRAGTLWHLARDPEHNFTFGIWNEKAENSQRWVGAIGKVVEASYLFQALWREMIPRGIGYWDKDAGVTRPRNWKWGDTGLLFERTNHSLPELSIEPHGIGGAVTGKHFTHKVLDDIIGEEASTSQASMQDAINWVNNCRPLESPAENGNELVIHTPWAYSDVYSHLLKRYPNEYKIHVRHMLETPDGKPDHINGESIWPEKLSTAKCHQMMGGDKHYHFMSQYMCIPQIGGDQAFRNEWFRYGRIVDTTGSEPLFRIDPECYDPNLMDQASGDDNAPALVALHWLDKCVLLDPAPSRDTHIRKEPHSDNGIVVVGKDPWNRRYLLDCWSGREGPVELLHRLMSMCDRWRTTRIAVEEVAMAAWVRPLFEQIIRHEYDWMPSFVPTHPKGREKPERIRTKLIGPIQNGYWYFNRATTAPVVLQLGEFPLGAKNDLIDALAYTDEVVSALETPGSVQRNWYQRRHDEDRGETGYGRFY
jgi:hypothetical protein